MSIQDLVYFPQFTPAFLAMLCIVPPVGFIVGERYGKHGNVTIPLMYCISVSFLQMGGHYIFHLW